MFGSVILIFEFAPSLNYSLGNFWNSAIFLPFGGVIWLILKVTRKHVLTPRIGVVIFSKARRTKLSQILPMSMFINTSALILGFDQMERVDDQGWTTAMIFVSLVLMLFWIAAYFLDFSRLYAYGILLAIPPLVGELLRQQWDAVHQGFPITLSVVAAIMISTGFAQFVKVVRNNPVLSIEA